MLHGILGVLAAIELVLGGLVMTFPQIAPQSLGIVVVAVGLSTLAVSVETIWKSINPGLPARAVALMRKVFVGIGVLLVTAVIVVYVYQAPIVIGRPVTTKNENGTFTITIPISVEQNSALGRLYLYVKSTDIRDANVRCQTGFFGHPQKVGVDVILTSIRDPNGEYCVIVVSGTDKAEITYDEQAPEP